MKLRIRNPFYFVETKDDWTPINCFHCGKKYIIYIPSIRALNYCTECK